MARIPLLLLLLWPFLPAQAQRYFFENLSVQQGLPASKVYTALQDSTGLVWIGTEAGVASYDGTVVQAFGPAQGTAGNGARTLFLDQDERLWVGHLGGGISLREGAGFRTIVPDGASLTSDITGITQAADGAWWITTFGQGALRLSKGQDDGAWPAERYGSAQGISDRITGITRLRNGTLLLLEDQGTIKRWDPAARAFQAYTPAGITGMYRITSLFEDARGALWIGTVNAGAFRTEANGQATQYDLPNGMPSNFVFSFGEDDQGRVWIGTWDKGVVRVQQEGLQRFDPGNGLHSIAIRAIARDREGNLLICTNDNGVDIYKGERFVNFGTEEGLVDPQVWAVLEDRSGQVWFGTNGGISILDPGNFSTARVKSLTMQQGALTTNRVRSLAQAPNGRIWIGTEDGGLFQFDPASYQFRYDLEISGSIPDNRVTALAISNDGDIWVGTINGLVRYKPGSAPQVLTTTEGLPANYITSLALDPEGTLWVGCLNKGIAQVRNGSLRPIIADVVFTPTAFAWDGQGRTWVGSEGSGIRVFGAKDTTVLDIRSGLLSNTIRSLVTDARGNVWIGTNRGLNVHWKENDRLTSFTERAGFIGIETKPGAATATRSGLLWFGTAWGATRVDPAALDHRPAAPLIAIRKLSVNFEDRPVDQGLQLSHTERDIRIDYGSVSLSDPQAVAYQYMLEGSENEWQPLTHETDVHYPALPPGRYTFRVKAVDRFNLWSEPVAFPFTILPPWYRSWWFYSLLGLLIGAGTFSYIKVRERQLRLRNMVLERKVEERTAEVVAQSKEIAVQKVQIEDLLLNILPRQISDELKEKGRATARQHEQVTVMFTDMKGFTQVAERMTPQQLVGELDECFIRFDAIVDRYGIEKIKTIGDSYMCACGIPAADPHHAPKSVMAAMEVRDEMVRWEQERTAQGMQPWVLRIGLHSGPVVAGVVGKRKFAYDIWGDTVNTASRMESSGVTGEINISGATHLLVAEWFECEHRGKVQAKNKGEIDMYFVRRLKPAYSADAEGRRPNARFLQVIAMG